MHYTALGVVQSRHVTRHTSYAIHPENGTRNTRTIQAKCISFGTSGKVDQALASRLGTHQEQGWCGMWEVQGRRGGGI